MGNFDYEFDEKLKRQSWALYAVGMLMISIRLYARGRKLGIANYQADDYLMILAAGLYTALIVTLNVIADGGGSNLYPPELEGTFTPAQVQDRIYGSKIVVVSEQAMLSVIYTLKACMLLMYARLTTGLRDERNVRYLAAYVAAGWLATELAFFAACRPFRGYWAMPPPDPQCTTLERYAVVQGCFNISSDLLMLCIPLPLVARARLPRRQKLALALVFSLGAFVVAAALLTKVFNLTDVYSPEYMLWYAREAGVAVCVTNLPMIWPLLRDWFPALRYLPPGLSTKKRGRGRGRGRGRSGSAGAGASLGLGRYGTHSASPINKTTTTTTLDDASSAVAGGDKGASATPEGLVAGPRRRPGSLAREEDLEMATRRHGLGDEDSDEEGEGERGGKGKELKQGRGGAEVWTARVRSPPKLAVAGRTEDPWPDPVESRRKSWRMEKEARKMALKGGIQVQTTVEVTEERTPEPTVVRAYGWGTVQGGGTPGHEGGTFFRDDDNSAFRAI